LSQFHPLVVETSFSLLFSTFALWISHFDFAAFCSFQFALVLNVQTLCVHFITLQGCILFVFPKEAFSFSGLCSRRQFLCLFQLNVRQEQDMISFMMFSWCRTGQQQRSMQLQEADRLWGIFLVGTNGIFMGEQWQWGCLRGIDCITCNAMVYPIAG
jgi:hypothetical protein